MNNQTQRNSKVYNIQKLYSTIFLIMLIVLTFPDIIYLYFREYENIYDHKILRQLKTFCVCSLTALGDSSKP